MQHDVSRDTLSKIPLFEGLTDREKSAVALEGRLKTFLSKQHLFDYGSAATHFYVICSGIVKIFRVSPDGHEKVTDILTAGCTVGERAVFESSGVYQSNAEAVKDSIVIEFPLAWLKQSIKKYPQMSLNLIAQIAHQAEETALEAEHQTQNSAARLLACFLQRLCLAHDFNPHSFELPYTKSLIAARLGMELETFSRTLFKLRQQGILVKGSHVSFEDLSLLEGHICSNCSVADTCPTRKELRKKD